MKTAPSIVAAGFVLLALAACSPAAAPADTASPSVTAFPEGSTMARLANAGQIAIGTKFDQPLFGLKGLDGTPAGFDVEIARIITNELGIPETGITWTETPSSVRDEAISSGKVDLVVATYTINDERKTRVTFAGPYYRAGTQLLVSKDSALDGPESLGDGDAIVCSVTGASYLDKLGEFLKSPEQLVLFDVYSKCADALTTGQVDAVAADSSILLGLSSANPGKWDIVGKSFSDQYYGIGMLKGDLGFCEFVNDTLADAVADGRYDAAWAATAGKVEPEVAPLPEPIDCE